MTSINFWFKTCVVEYMIDFSTMFFSWMSALRQLEGLRESKKKLLFVLKQGKKFVDFGEFSKNQASLGFRDLSLVRFQYCYSTMLFWLL